MTNPLMPMPCQTESVEKGKEQVVMHDCVGENSNISFYKKKKHEKKS